MNMYVLPGALLAGAGFVTIFVLLAKMGALSKMKQFGAFADLLSGNAGNGMRLAFLLGVSAMMLGTCGTFAGVASHDRERAERCNQTCLEKGYKLGSIRGSTEMATPKKHAFVACACLDGPAPDPLELKADDFMER